jgi:UDP-N-acetylmuramate dehydrogenase
MAGGSSILRGQLRLEEPLARHTSWRVGGPARRLYRPADAEDLAVFLGQLDPPEPLLWLRLGSNVLIPDAGFPGTVIENQVSPTPIARSGDTGILAEAGVACAKLARFAAREGLIGAEFLAGIPGTLGGGLAMNAGAWRGETWAQVVGVQTIDRRGAIRERRPSDFAIGYREVKGPAGEWFLDARLELRPGDGEAGLERIRALLEQRVRTQPTGLPSCGSVFRNPPGDHAARLSESIGVKGYRLGGAQVSEKHANFIINTGTASALDIASLIEHVRAQVEEHTGVHPVPEVRRVGGGDV